MKTITITLILLVYNSVVFSQAPIAQWEKGFGGSFTDVGEKIIEQTNGHFLICGYTLSHDHDAATNHGNNDLLFLNLNEYGVRIDGKCFGGTWDDRGNTVLVKNNELLLFGTASSDDYDLNGIHNMASGSDLWLLKTDSLLNISFQKTIGSQGSDDALKMILSDDGGFVFLDKIGMAGNDVDTAYGHDDLWVVKTDSLASIQWQITLGSQLNEAGGDIVKAKNGGYIIGGSAGESSGTVTCGPLNGSLWFVKLDSLGSVVWQHCFSIGIPKKIIPTSDGGFVIAAITYDSTISGYSGYSDYLLLKVDSLGNQLWAHCYGGSQFDTPTDLIQCSDGGFLVAGTSDSYDFYASTSNGNKDALLVKVDSSGTFEWSHCYGGIDDETCNSVVETFDGGYALTGTTKSWAGLPHYGDDDLWVLKLNFTGIGIFTPENSIEYIKSYSSSEGIGIEVFSKKDQDVSICVFDVSGRKLLSDKKHLVIGKNSLNYNLNEAKGVFIIQVNTNDGWAVNKLIR